MRWGTVWLRRGELGVEKGCSIEGIVSRVQSSRSNTKKQLKRKSHSIATLSNSPSCTPYAMLYTKAYSIETL